MLQGIPPTHDVALTSHNHHSEKLPLTYNIQLHVDRSQQDHHAPITSVGHDVWQHPSPHPVAHPQHQTIPCPSLPKKVRPSRRQYETLVPRGRHNLRHLSTTEAVPDRPTTSGLKHLTPYGISRQHILLLRKNQGDHRHGKRKYAPALYRLASHPQDCGQYTRTGRHKSPHPIHIRIM